MANSNTLRCFKLLEFLTRYSNQDKTVNSSQIISYLEQQDIFVTRKTVYSDIQTLIEAGHNIEVVNNIGFKLLSGTFEVSEIKLLSDALMASKFIDLHYRKEINQKLLSFISEDEAKIVKNFLDDDENKTNQQKKYHINEITRALLDNRFMEMDGQIIFPYHLHRYNDKYYLLYSYQNNPKTYFRRIDHIQEIHYLEHSNQQLAEQEKERIIKQDLKNRIHMFKGEIYRVQLKVHDEQDKKTIYLIQDIFDDVIEIDSQNFAVNGQCSDVFFSRLSLLANRVTIIKPEIVKQSYQQFLETILNHIKNP